VGFGGLVFKLLLRLRWIYLINEAAKGHPLCREGALLVGPLVFLIGGAFLIFVFVAMSMLWPV
jgi:hypothetical protein